MTIIRARLRVSPTELALSQEEEPPISVLQS